MRPVISSLAGAVMVMAGTCCALAQMVVTDTGAIVAADGQDAFSGRDFAGLALDLPTQAGPVNFSSRRAITWTQEPQAGTTISGQRATMGAPVQRLLLLGDVRVQIGGSIYSAARATVWLEELEPAGGQKRHQVAVYFDRVSMPAAAASSSTAGDRVLLTGVVAGDLVLASDAPPQRTPPSTDAFVREGESRLGRYLAQLAGVTLEGLDQPAPEQRTTPAADVDVGNRLVPGRSQPYEPGSPLSADGLQLERAAAARRVARGGSAGSGVLLGDALADGAIFGSRGVFTIAAGEPVLKQDGLENHLIVTGGVSLQYSEGGLRAGSGRGLLLSSQNAVVFLKPGPLEDLFKAGADQVIGVYLEGDVVATDGRFTLRGPHVYYDVASNRAFTVDAVFWTYDETRNLPLYVRAQSLRQVTRQSVKAEGVSIAASSFFDPQLSLGARSVTVSRVRDTGSEQTRTLIEADGISPRLLGLPIGYLPSFEGDLDRFTLRDIRFENSSASGAGIQTRWDALGLTGLDAPPDLRIDLLLDAWLRRGVGVGVDAAWNGVDDKGSVLGYVIASDNGTDVLSTGARREREDETRSLLLYEQALTLDNGWQAMLEGTFVSDENFVDAYYETLAEERREFSSSALVRKTDDNSVFTAQMKGTFNDFAPNEDLIQSRGLIVQKLPEAIYSRVADDVLSGVKPGLVHWTSQYRAGLLSFRFFEPTARQFGFRDDARAQNGLGFDADQSWGEVLRDAGLDESSVFRADTRQEVAVNLEAGPVKITPFAVGRLTMYDDRFAKLTNKEQDDRMRWSASGGVRASTQVQRVYSDAKSDLLGIDGLRHIIEPSATVWTSGTNRRRNSLPIYDEDVEGAAEGTAYRVGLGNTFQTKRVTELADLNDVGKITPGSRIVDVFKVQIDYTTVSSDTDRTSPIGRWIDYRPELSQLGDFLVSEATWLIADSTRLTFQQVYDFEASQAQRTVAGVAIDHTIDFKTYADLRFLNPRDVTFIDLGADYRLTPLYTIAAEGTVDTDEGQVQEVGVRVNRELRDLTFSIKARYSNITSETTLGVVITPLDRARQQVRFRRLGRDQFLEGLTSEP
jgi:hypothetical protein